MHDVLSASLSLRAPAKRRRRVACARLCPRLRATLALAATPGNRLLDIILVLISALIVIFGCEGLVLVGEQLVEGRDLIALALELVDDLPKMVDEHAPAGDVRSCVHSCVLFCELHVDAIIVDVSDKNSNR
jgi:hypothetical protein